MRMKFSNNGRFFVFYTMTLCSLYTSMCWVLYIVTKLMRYQNKKHRGRHTKLGTITQRVCQYESRVNPTACIERWIAQWPLRCFFILLPAFYIFPWISTLVSLCISTSVIHSSGISLGLCPMHEFYRNMTQIELSKIITDYYVNGEPLQTHLSLAVWQLDHIDENIQINSLSFAVPCPILTTVRSA